VGGPIDHSSFRIKSKILVLYAFSYTFLNVKSHPRMHQKPPPFSGKNSNFGARQSAPLIIKFWIRHCRRKRRVLTSTYLQNSSVPRSLRASSWVNRTLASLLCSRRPVIVLHHLVVKVDGTTLMSTRRDVNDTTWWIASSQHVHQQMSQQKMTLQYSRKPVMQTFIQTRLFLPSAHW